MYGQDNNRIKNVLIFGMIISAFMLMAFSSVAIKKFKSGSSGINLAQAQSMPYDADIDAFDNKNFSNDFEKNDMGFVVTKMRKIMKKKNASDDVTSTSSVKNVTPNKTVCCNRNNISAKCLVRTDKEYMTKSECKAKKSKLGINNCMEDVDYWAKGVEQCGHISRMVDEETLANIANDIYKSDHVIQPRENNTNVSGYDSAKWQKYFGDEGTVGIWANVESTGKYVGRSHWRYFGKPKYSGDLGAPSGQTGWRGNGIRSLNSETRYTYCLCN